VFYFDEGRMRMQAWLTGAGAALALVALGGSGTSVAGDAGPEPFGKLTLGEVARLIEQRTAVIVDANSRDRYEKGHVPTARWLDFSSFTAGDLPKDRGQEIVFYCHNTR
jgi:3-mercaptopyruvate sulfurtransferase SseA